MLFGVESCDVRRRPGSGGPPAAYASADFVNGIYSYNGSSVAVTDVITDRSPTLISGSGLHIPAAVLPVPIVADFSTALLTGNWTMVLDMNIDASGPLAVLYDFYSQVSGYDNEIFFQVNGDWECNDKNANWPHGVGGLDRYCAEYTNALSSGNHKLAVTRTNSRLSFSVDGFPVQTDSSTTFPFETGISTVTLLGGYNGGGNTEGEFYVHSLAIYNPVDDADLPTLST